MRVGFVSLGCSKNRVDTEHMMGLLLEAGHSIVNKRGMADAIIVNTCGFIGDAKKEAIDTIIEMGLLKKRGKIRILVATGCLAQRYPDDLIRELPELDAVIGVSEWSSLPQILDKCAKGERVLKVAPWPKEYSVSSPRLISTDPGIAYLKISEGCNNRCSYCAIPLIRGPVRSRPLDELVEEAYRLANDGIRELVLVAQDLTSYGNDLRYREGLETLVSELNRIPGIEWIRLMYAHPRGINDSFLRLFQFPRVVPYLDLPIQHGSNRILNNMRRKYQSKDVYDLVAQLRETVPKIILRTTFMTGYPGETIDDHKQTVLMLRDLEFDWVGFFQYSEEDGTMAAEQNDNVSARLKSDRCQELMAVQQEITFRKNKHRIGLLVPVLIEAQSGEKAYKGRAWFQAPEVDGVVYVRSQVVLKSGQIFNVRITETDEYDLTGELAVEAIETRLT
ncbi:MAG: 30S ribosomal protein S12 methylthiotransferase RimO [Chitinophagales bacterium]